MGPEVASCSLILSLPLPNRRSHGFIGKVALSDEM
jgi:hypothetical protein